MCVNVGLGQTINENICKKQLTEIFFYFLRQNNNIDDIF